MQSAVPEFRAPPAAQALPPELHNIVHALCDTYETLDLRVETTLGSAERDFCAALPEMEGHDVELKQLVGMLINDLRTDTDGNMAQPVLLQLAFNDKDELVEKLQSTVNQLEAVE